MRTRTYRQRLTHIKELRDRASNQERGRLTAEYRVAQDLKILKAEDTELTALGRPPRLAAQIIAEVADELDSGEIGEFAYDAAITAGLDPQKWQDDLEAETASCIPATPGWRTDPRPAAACPVRALVVRGPGGERQNTRWSERDEGT
ncbi:hypothetical protein ACIGN6_32060 [Streptomyces sp. NPDC053792]|uniref:hypothetical protein n=1 Tax=Streptomyces sp. NPDC053792 TaxID=3365716 RepID=UPI0037CCCA4E